jgi:hypothetical protein
MRRRARSEAEGGSRSLTTGNALLVTSHSGTIIGIVGTLAGVIVGFALNVGWQLISESRLARRQLASIKASVKIAALDNHAAFTRALEDLHALFVANPDLLEWSENNRDFAHKWLGRVSRGTMRTGHFLGK